MWLQLRARLSTTRSANEWMCGAYKRCTNGVEKRAERRIEQNNSNNNKKNEKKNEREKTGIWQFRPWLGGNLNYLHRAHPHRGIAELDGVLILHITSRLNIAVIVITPKTLFINIVHHMHGSDEAGRVAFISLALFDFTYDFVVVVVAVVAARCCVWWLLPLCFVVPL